MAATRKDQAALTQLDAQYMTALYAKPRLARAQANRRARMSQRLIHRGRGQCTVHPHEDEMILAGRKDRLSGDYLLHARRGTQVFYFYRPRGREGSDTRPEVCEEVSRGELQESIMRRAEYDDLAEYADIPRLKALGFRIPEPSTESGR